MSKDGKIRFVLARSESGRFRARAVGFDEAVGDTLTELRSSINRIVREQLGQERPVALMVGAPLASPGP